MIYFFQTKTGIISLLLKPRQRQTNIKLKENRKLIYLIQIDMYKACVLLWIEMYILAIDLTMVGHILSIE